MICLLLGGAAPAKEESRQYNVILISLDTLRADHLGCYGYQRNTSPNIDAFAAKSILFENVMSCSPWTTPSHFSIFTSLYPQNHGLRDYPVPGVLPEGGPKLLAEMFREQGYATAGFHGGAYVDGHFGFNRGFDRYESHGKKMGDNISYALDWLKEKKGTPFFMFLHCYDVHSPYSPPLDIKEKFLSELPQTLALGSPHTSRTLHSQNLFKQQQEALYDAELFNMDSELSGLFRFLNEAGLWNNTLVILFSDHGEEFYEHGGWGHVTTLYQEVLHVPLIIRLPGKDAAGEHVRELVRTVDISPTILSLAGLPPLPQGDGTNLTPSSARLAAFSSVPFHPEQSTPEAFAETEEGGRKRALYSAGEKLIFNLSAETKELYNLGQDPVEQENRSEKDKGTTKRLLSRLYSLMGAFTNCATYLDDQVKVENGYFYAHVDSFNEQVAYYFKVPDPNLPITIDRVKSFVASSVGEAAVSSELEFRGPALAMGRRVAFDPQEETLRIKGNFGPKDRPYADFSIRRNSPYKLTAECRVESGAGRAGFSVQLLDADKKELRTETEATAEVDNNWTQLEETLPSQATAGASYARVRFVSQVGPTATTSFKKILLSGLESAKWVVRTELTREAFQGDGLVDSSDNDPQEINVQDASSDWTLAHAVTSVESGKAYRLSARVRPEVGVPVLVVQLLDANKTKVGTRAARAEGPAGNWVPVEIILSHEETARASFLRVVALPNAAGKQRAVGRATFSEITVEEERQSEESKEFGPASLAVPPMNMTYTRLLTDQFDLMELIDSSPRLAYALSTVHINKEREYQLSMSVLAPSNPGFVFCIVLDESKRMLRYGPGRAVAPATRWQKLDINIPNDRIRDASYLKVVLLPTLIKQPQAKGHMGVSEVKLVARQRFDYDAEPWDDPDLTIPCYPDEWRCLAFNGEPVEKLPFTFRLAEIQSDISLPGYININKIEENILALRANRLSERKSETKLGFSVEVVGRWGQTERKDLPTRERKQIEIAPALMEQLRSLGYAGTVQRGKNDEVEGIQEVVGE